MVRCIVLVCVSLLLVTSCFDANDKQLSISHVSDEPYVYDSSMLVCGTDKDISIYLGETYASISKRLNHHLNVNDWYGSEDSDERMGFFTDTLSYEGHDIFQWITLYFLRDTLESIIIKNYSRPQLEVEYLLNPVSSCPFFDEISKDNFILPDTLYTLYYSTRQSHKYRVTVKLILPSSLYPSMEKMLFVTYKML